MDSFFDGICNKCGEVIRNIVLQNGEYICHHCADPKYGYRSSNLPFLDRIDSIKLRPCYYCEKNGVITPNYTQIQHKRHISSGSCRYVPNFVCGACWQGMSQHFRESSEHDCFKFDFSFNNHRNVSYLSKTEHLKPLVSAIMKKIKKVCRRYKKFLYSDILLLYSRNESMLKTLLDSDMIKENVLENIEFRTTKKSLQILETFCERRGMNLADHNHSTFQLLDWCTDRAHLDDIREFLIRTRGPELFRMKTINQTIVSHREHLLTRWRHQFLDTVTIPDMADHIMSFISITK